MNLRPGKSVELSMLQGWANLGRLTARLLVFGLCVCRLSWKSSATELAYKPAPVDNPLKGLMVSPYGEAQQFPHSLQYIEIALSRLMIDQNRFDWKPLDDRLHSISIGGRQVVIRVYMDWPGRTNTIPPFLYDATDIEKDGWRKGERIPNYESPAVRAALKNFITAFGERYDGHPDIGFIEAGLLGAWGEWLQAGRAPPVPTLVQQEILTAYETAFQTTKILVRFATPFTLERAFGYHDDWFGQDNGNMRYGVLSIADQTAWERVPIGGRVHPKVQDRMCESSNPRLLDDNDLAKLRSGHFSYMRVEWQNAIQPGASWDAALKFARMVGYEFYVAAAQISYAPNNRALSVGITIRNTGIAPFYYRWPIELALAKGNDLSRNWNVDWDIRSVLPGGEGIEFRFAQSDLSIPAGEYHLLARIRNPAPRGLPVSFANETQDADIPGWLTLGSVTVSN